MVNFFKLMFFLVKLKLSLLEGKRSVMQDGSHFFVVSLSLSKILF